MLSGATVMTFCHDEELKALLEARLKPLEAKGNKNSNDDETVVGDAGKSIDLSFPALYHVISPVPEPAPKTKPKKTAQGHIVLS